MNVKNRDKTVSLKSLKYHNVSSMKQPFWSAGNVSEIWPPVASQAASSKSASTARRGLQQSWKGLALKVTDSAAPLRQSPNSPAPFKTPTTAAHLSGARARIDPSARLVENFEVATTTKRDSVAKSKALAPEVQCNTTDDRIRSRSYSPAAKTTNNLLERSADNFSGLLDETSTIQYPTGSSEGDASIKLTSVLLEPSMEDIDNGAYFAPPLLKHPRGLLVNMGVTLPHANLAQCGESTKEYFSSEDFNNGCPPRHNPSIELYFRQAINSTDNYPPPISTVATNKTNALGHKNFVLLVAARRLVMSR